MYIYPKDIKEFENKDVYEIKHWNLDDWTTTQTFTRNLCHGKKVYIIFLIKGKRIRIVK